MYKYTFYLTQSPAYNANYNTFLFIGRCDRANNVISYMSFNTHAYTLNSANKVTHIDGKQIYDSGNSGGTVTSVKVGSTSYNPSSGVVSLPAYPTVPTVNNGTFKIQSDANDIASFTANSSTNVTVNFASGVGIALVRDTTNKKITAKLNGQVVQEDITNTTSKTTTTFDLNTYNCSAGTIHGYELAERITGNTNAFTGAYGVANRPSGVNLAFTVSVRLVRWTSTSDYTTRQVLWVTGANIIYYRWCTNGTWGSWTRAYITDNNTTDTCGAGISTSKLFIVGRTAQSTGTSNSNTNCYIGTDSCLYSNGSKVLTSIESAYPVGSIYMNASNSTNPATLLGFGTWAELAPGRVLMGAGNENYTAGNEYGEYSHTLSTDEMPTHGHGVWLDGATTQASWASYDSNGSVGDGGTNVSSWTRNEGQGCKWDGTDYKRYYYYQQTHNHNVYQSDAGGGGAHNNVQPSLVVYMWVRTA